MASGNLFEDEIRGRKSKDGKRPTFRSIPKRVGDLVRNTRGHPEVVIKISSYAKDRSRAGAHANYVTRRDKEGGDLTAELADGSVLHEAGEVNEVLDSWFAHQEKRTDARRTVNIVLSSPAKSDPVKVKAAVRQFSADFFGNNDYMFVIHTDTNNPHAHLTVKMRDFDGKQLRLNKPELQTMRERYASALREQGIEVNASYRTDRGQWRKAKSSAIYHMDNINVEKRHQSRISAALKAEATQSQLSIQKHEPWRQAMQKRRDTMEAEYRGAAKYLRAEYGDTFEREAMALDAYGKALPKPSTQLDEEIAAQQGINKKPQNRHDRDLER